MTLTLRKPKPRTAAEKLLLKVRNEKHAELRREILKDREKQQRDGKPWWARD